MVVGFTALKASFHKGFSLVSTMSTVIIHNPKGDRANALTEWTIHHQDLLADKQARVLDVKNPSAEKMMMIIEALKRKKLSIILQEEWRWLRVVVPEPDFDKINAYIGCSNCGKRTDVPVGKAYACTTCSKDTVASPRYLSLLRDMEEE